MAYNALTITEKLVGTWFEDPVTANVFALTESGGVFTVTCPTAAWSPATANLSGKKLTFVTGMTGLTADLTESTMKLSFSNGVTWQKQLQLHGHYVEDPITASRIKIEQNNDKITCHCPQAVWTPAAADILAQEVVFTLGMPPGLTATKDFVNDTLVFNNGSKWKRSFTGLWKEQIPSAYRIDITQSGNNLTMVCPGAVWSPGSGTINGTDVTLSGAFPPGMTATFDYVDFKFTFSNGLVWVIA